ncbi:MAG: hypothetical protein A2020_14285 [Lentisphaerae bacterium GWF2_45_14]|nr:MAG: hypothetical protein A2020_14285 [Lentisphaerae bacterium GWF2_45_14]
MKENLNSQPENPSGTPLTLLKFVARSGLASRRGSFELIKNGNISVNGNIITEPSFPLAGDEVVTANKKRLQVTERHYFMLNKPVGYICTNDDPNAQLKAVDLIDVRGVRLFSVGRLDKDSEGLLLFTDDGDFAARLTHPRYGIIKTYKVWTDKPLSIKMIDTLCEGVTDQGEKLSALSITPESELVYIFKMKEGKKREIRRLIGSLNRKTARLQRIAVGGLFLGDLPAGKWKPLSSREIKLALRNQ